MLGPSSHDTATSATSVGDRRDGSTSTEAALDAASALLASSAFAYDGDPVGTVAAVGAEQDLNYHECFTRDFAVVAAASLLRGDSGIVANFLRLLSRLQARDHVLDCFEPGAGLMPASFFVAHEGGNEAVVADFGQRAIGGVAPVDAALWWLLTLRS